MSNHYQLNITSDLDRKLSDLGRQSLEGRCMRNFVDEAPAMWISQSQCTHVRNIEYRFMSTTGDTRQGDMWLSSQDYRNVAVIEFKHMRWDVRPDIEDWHSAGWQPRKPGRRPGVERNHKKNKAREQAEAAFEWLGNMFPDAALRTAWVFWNEQDGKWYYELVCKQDNDRAWIGPPEAAAAPDRPRPEPVARDSAVKHLASEQIHVPRRCSCACVCTTVLMLIALFSVMLVALVQNATMQRKS
eukprot:TRINITY_DN2235_c0_g1_i1.p1 TRINITY_DN2235_c0_g1~~TRINITY_DN2235_c0_g1_i1.p1  ORF type:complete len:243 (-),score=11.02 TRINITY_DN2235_c0_g1_i1:3-731(-)